MSVMAGDIMNRDVISVPEDMDLRDLAKLFLEKGITGAPVVDGDGNLQGVISQTDLLYYSLIRDDELVMDSHFYHAVRVEGHHIPRGFEIQDVNTGRVADVMTPVVHSVTERASIASISRLMRRKHIHRVIVRKGRKVAGIISALDLLRSVGDLSGGRAAPGKGSRSSVARNRKTATAATKSRRRA